MHHGFVGTEIYGMGFLKNCPIRRDGIDLREIVSIPRGSNWHKTFGELAVYRRETSLGKRAAWRT